MPAAALRTSVRLQTLLLMLLAALVLFAARPTSANDNASPPATQPAAGRLVLTGSTTLSNLVSLWAEAFRQFAPAVSLTIANPGSAAGLESLLNGSAEAVLISTPLSERQRQRFIDRYDYAPSRSEEHTSELQSH